MSQITGAASGIGAATAKLFGGEGATVIVADIDEANGRRIAGEIGASAVFHKTNVREPGEVESMVVADGGLSAHTGFFGHPL